MGSKSRPKKPSQNKASGESQGKGLLIPSLCVLVFAVVLFIVYGNVNTVAVDDTVQDATNSHAEPFKFSSKAFAQWVKSYGGVVNKVKVHDGARGRGLFLYKNYKVGDQLYQVPEDVWISEKTLKVFSDYKTVLANPEFEAELSASVASNHHKTLLVWGMLYEMSLPKSHWTPYFDSLPQWTGQTDTIPFVFFWSEEDLSQLQSQTLMVRIRSWREGVTKDYERVKEWLLTNHGTLMEKAIPELDLFFFTYYNLISRSFDCQLPKNGSLDFDSKFHNSYDIQPCLIPFCDMVNHEHSMSNRNSMVVEMPALQAFYNVESPVNYKKGDELIQSYAGDPSTLSTTTHYLTTYALVNGVMDDASGDFITLRYQAKSDVVCAIGSDGLLREDFMAIVSSDLRLTDEKAVVKIRELVESELNALPTTLEQDWEQLESNTLTYKALLAIRFRIRFKRIMFKLITNLKASEANGDLSQLYTRKKFPFTVDGSVTAAKESMIQIRIASERDSKI